MKQTEQRWPLQPNEELLLDGSSAAWSRSACTSLRQASGRLEGWLQRSKQRLLRLGSRSNEKQDVCTSVYFLDGTPLLACLARAEAPAPAFVKRRLRSCVRAVKQAKQRRFSQTKSYCLTLAPLAAWSRRSTCVCLRQASGRLEGCSEASNASSQPKQRKGSETLLCLLGGIGAGCLLAWS